MSTTIRPVIAKKNQYYISKHRYYELKHFCLQYPEWKKAYESIDGYSAHNGVYSFVPRTTDVKDFTYICSENRIYYKERMEIVENAAQEAVNDLYIFLLKSVTEGVSYERLSPPCCKEVWYAGYRRFFWLLDKARK